MSEQSVYRIPEERELIGLVNAALAKGTSIQADLFNPQIKTVDVLHEDMTVRIAFELDLSSGQRRVLNPRVINAEKSEQ